MVEVGSEAPDFEAPGPDGRPFHLAETRGAPVVLYFYPKAHTAGCAREAREFARHHDEFARRGIRVVGVSVDAVEDQRSFAEECRVPFPLVADSSGAIARRYGVLGAFRRAQRVTFLLGPDFRVQEVIRSILPGPHVAGALAWAARAPATA